MDDPTKCVKLFNEPATIVFENVTMHANLSVEDSNNIIYAMEGLSDAKEFFHFIIADFKVISSEPTVTPASKDDFKMEGAYGTFNNTGVLWLLKGLDGPQDIEMTINVMPNDSMTHSNMGTLHRTILRIYVSKYNLKHFSPSVDTNPVTETTTATTPLEV